MREEDLLARKDRTEVSEFQRRKEKRGETHVAVVTVVLSHRA